MDRLIQTSPQKPTGHVAFCAIHRTLFKVTFLQCFNLVDGTFLEITGPTQLYLGLAILGSKSYSTYQLYGSARDSTEQQEGIDLFSF